jgi:hypothetical protein
MFLNTAAMVILENGSTLLVCVIWFQHESLRLFTNFHQTQRNSSLIAELPGFSRWQWWPSWKVAAHFRLYVFGLSMIF